MSILYRKELLTPWLTLPYAPPLTPPAFFYETLLAPAFRLTRLESSPSCAHLPLHGHIYPFMGTSSPHLPIPQTYAQVHSVGFALCIAYAELNLTSLQLNLTLWDSCWAQMRRSIPQPSLEGFHSLDTLPVHWQQQTLETPQTSKSQTTVDGRNPAPPGMYKTLYRVG